MSELKETTGVLAEYDKIAAGINALREKYDGRVYDVTTTAGMKDAKAARMEVRTARTDVEKIRKALKGPHLERGRKIDGDAKLITAALLEVEAPIHELIAAEDKRKAEAKAEKERIERERVAGIQDRINGLRFVLSEYHPSGDIQSFIDGLEVQDIDGAYDEFDDMAKDVIEDSRKKANLALEKAVAREDEAERQAEEKKRLAEEKAELEKQRKEQAAKQAELDAAEAEAKALSEDAAKDVEPVKPKAPDNDPEPADLALAQIVARCSSAEDPDGIIRDVYEICAAYIGGN